MKVLVTLCLLALVVGSMADCYMQNPRGSNDRLNGQGVNRNNGNRLFDSQNNAKGGYCWGPKMYFYVGSLLTVEWTQQHSCGHPNSDCNMVLQYMCGSEVRDGTVTTTIPDNVNTYNEQVTQLNVVTGETETVYRYGMHEDYWYYQRCKQRSRNGGLFIADRNLGQDKARFTRQNNGGTRRGFECPEERDYYPYWGPTPWKDIAVLVTKDVRKRCKFYRAESQNVKAKGNCSIPLYGSESECGVNGGNWEEVGKWDIDAPECLGNAWTRDNHLGNTMDGRANQYNWTIPDDVHDNCVLRIRYNISTDDYDGWVDGVDAKSNGKASPVTQDPEPSYEGKNLSLALNTNQYGRTFQDRTHIFEIRERPKEYPKHKRIFNLNVRGKRGNIVQTYPATEYDFAPAQLYVRQGDYIHFQWTGCDNNPQNYAGEGTRGTDRSNIVQLKASGTNYPYSHDPDEKKEDKKDPNNMFPDDDIRERMAHLDQVNCTTYAILEERHNGDNNDIEEDPQYCAKLNGAVTPYFDGGAIKMNKTGNFNYMSSRNNNYTNRSQKASLVVVPLLPVWAIVLLVLGAASFIGSGGVMGAQVYAKSHPGSGVANIFNKV